MLCFHTHVKQFTGYIDFVSGPQAKLQVNGLFYGAHAQNPFSVTIELPQYRCIPWWLQALTALTSQFTANWNKPRVTLPSLHYFDFDQWQINIPLYGALKLQDVCGYLPVHVVVHQNNQEFIRMVLQRRQYCTHLKHNECNDILYTNGYDLNGARVQKLIVR